MLKQKITPFLWFNGQAEEAMNLYTTIFKNSKVVSLSRWGDSGPMPKGTVMSVIFQLEGQDFIALNGGPMFTFSPAISLFVSCETQEEIDDYWLKLSAGGEIQMCGWMKDKFGVSWQIIPSDLGELMHSQDPEKSKRVMQAMLKMKKLIIAELRNA